MKAVLRAHDRNRAVSDEPFNYLWCGECGSLTIAGIPEDLGRYYPPGPYGLPSSAELLELLPGEEFKVGLLAARTPSGGRLLEVGPGAGAFAFAAKRSGFDVLTIEMDAATCAHMTDVVGAAVVRSSDPAAAITELDEAPDAIAMWHAIEHIPQPRRLLEAAAGALEPGGTLLLSTPNPEAIQLRLLRSRWVHLDAPRHLHLLSLQVVTSWLADCGLRREFLTTSDPTGRECNQLGWREAVRRRPSAGPPTRLTSEVGHALTLMAASAEERAMSGSTYTATFRKG